jgi:hypothetical protein
LSKALKGKAKDVAKALMINCKNVPKIINKLERNFGRPDFIIEALIEQVREAPSVYPGKFASAVEFGNTISNLVANTVALDQPRHLQNAAEEVRTETPRRTCGRMGSSESKEKRGR